MRRQMSTLRGAAKQTDPTASNPAKTWRDPPSTSGGNSLRRRRRHSLPRRHTSARHGRWRVPRTFQLRLHRVEGLEAGVVTTEARHCASDAAAVLQAACSRRDCPDASALRKSQSLKPMHRVGTNKVLSVSHRACPAMELDYVLVDQHLQPTSPGFSVAAAVGKICKGALVHA
jgi:hypothetical protein